MSILSVIRTSGERLFIGFIVQFITVLACCIRCHVRSFSGPVIKLNHYYLELLGASVVFYSSIMQMVHENANFHSIGRKKKSRARMHVNTTEAFSATHTI